MILRLLLLATAFIQLAFPQAFRLSQPETLTYRVEWRLITAGAVKLEWAPQTDPQDGYQVRLNLQSVGLVSKLFKVDNSYTANLDPAGCALSWQLITREGNRHRDTRVNFNYDNNKASYVDRDRVRNTVSTHELDVPGCVHDVIGGLYLLRNLHLELGQSTQIPVSDGKKAVMAKVTAQQRETIRAPEGTYQTVRYEVFLFDNVLYRRSAHLYVWLSDDARQLPVQIRVRMQFTIGTITLQLEKRE